MIHQKKLIAYILIFTIIFIFFLDIDNSSNATAVPLAVELGVPAAKAFLAMLLSLRATGVAVDTYEQARSMFRVIPGGQANDTPPPDDPPPDEQGPDGKFTWKEFLGLGLLGGAVTQQLKDFIDAFKGKFGEVQEGENIYNEQLPYLGVHSFNSTIIENVKGSVNASFIIIKKYTSDLYLVNFKLNEEGVYINGNRITRGLENDYYWNLIYNKDGELFIANKGVDGNNYSGHMWSKSHLFDNLILEIPQQKPNINYYITNNAPILDPVQNPPPDKIYIPYLPDLDPTNDKLKQIMLPSGEEQLVYEGTPDDYLNDVVNNVTFSQIQTGAVPGVVVTQPDGESYLILEPGTNEMPFPDIGTDPMPDTGQGLGFIASLLKGMTNWLSNIYNAILSIPQFLANLFTIPEGLSIDTSSLRMNGFTEKFPFSIPWDLYKAINVFASTPSDPNITVNINTDNLKVNHTLDLSLIDLPLRFARYAVTIFFIIFLATKTRDLIKW